MSSPTQRTLALLEARGYLPAVVERWIPGANIRRDLFGIADVLAIAKSDDERTCDRVVVVQVCNRSDVSDRIAKIAAPEHAEAVAALRRAGVRILVHGWGLMRRKRGRARVELREVDLS